MNRPALGYARGFPMPGAAARRETSSVGYPIAGAMRATP